MFAALGNACLAAFGKALSTSVLINVGVIVLGAIAAGFGVRMIASPTGFQMARSQGTDAFGVAQWGPSEPASASQTP